jgi:hypothetical protein
MLRFGTMLRFGLLVRGGVRAWQLARVVAVPVLRLPADPRFAHLDRATQQTDHWLHLHCLAMRCSMCHADSSVISYFRLISQRADAVPTSELNEVAS